jgi:hypothetical protein
MGLKGALRGLGMGIGSAAQYTASSVMISSTACPLRALEIRKGRALAFNCMITDLSPVFAATWLVMRPSMLRTAAAAAAAAATAAIAADTAATAVTAATMSPGDAVLSTSAELRMDAAAAAAVAVLLDSIAGLGGLPANLLRSSIC